jgi:hypothetical protein
VRRRLTKHAWTACSRSQAAIKGATTAAGPSPPAAPKRSHRPARTATARCPPTPPPFLPPLPAPRPLLRARPPAGWRWRFRCPATCSACTATPTRASRLVSKRGTTRKRPTCCGGGSRSCRVRGRKGRLWVGVGAGVGARASPQKSAAGLLWHVTDLLAWGGPSKQGRPYPATIGNRNRFVDHPAHPTHRAPARCTPSGQGAWTAASRRASRLSVPTALRCGQRCAACRPGGRRASSAQAVAFVSAQASTPPHLRPTAPPPAPHPSCSPTPQVGPINLRFTLPMYCASRLSLKYLQILKRDRSYSPQRWVSRWPRHA